MRRHITLDSGISIDKPRSSNVTSTFEDCVVDKFLQFWKPVLELMGNHEPRETSPDSDDSKLARLQRKLWVE